MVRKLKFISFVLGIALILSQASAFASTDNYVLKVTGNRVGTELKLSIDELKAIPAEAQIDEEHIYNSKSGEKAVL